MHPGPIPVTLNCSGGIALGAYMAGVFSELVTASLRPRAGRSEPLICIDTITGASAGAMTGLIATRCLLQDPEHSRRELADDAEHQPRQAETHQPANRFYQAWVKLADIRKLLDYRAEERQLRQTDDRTRRPRVRLGLLSGEAIADIAENVTGEWRDNDLDGMANALRTRSLALLMTTTNLQGVLRNSDDDVLTISHAETRRFLFHRSMAGLQTRELSELNTRWRKAKESARASGAFPAAFPPISNSSNPDSANLDLDAKSRRLYEEAATSAGDNRDPDDVCRFISQSRGTNAPRKQLRLRFDYTDGGVLDGLPILKGIELLNRIGNSVTEAPQDSRLESNRTEGELDSFRHDWHSFSPREEARRFVYVKPIPVTDLSSSTSLLRRFFGLAATGMAGLTYPKAEHDHLRLEDIETINRLVERRDQRIAAIGSDSEEAKHLRTILPYRRVSLAAIDPILSFRSATFRNLLLEETAKLTGSMPPEPVSDEVQALEHFERLLGKWSGPPTRGGRFLSASDLLATDFLGAFGGFFQERYRRHDYLVGRLSGLAWLHSLDPVGEEESTRATLKLLIQRAQRDYLPFQQRCGLRFPSDWLRLLRLIAVRLPYVILNDALTGCRRRPIALKGWQRRLLRLVIAPLVGIALLMVVPPLLAITAAILLLVGWLFGL